LNLLFGRHVCKKWVHVHVYVVDHLFIIGAETAWSVLRLETDWAVRGYNLSGGKGIFFVYTPVQTHSGAHLYSC
jgi:type II secretory pathway component PulL